MRRIAVVGVSGSGKTALARELAHRLDLPHVELDLVYFLDLPRALCYWRVLRRTLRGLVRRTSHLGEGFPERPAWLVESARYVFAYRRRQRPCVLALLERHPNAITLRSRRDVRRLLADLPPPPRRITRR